MGLLVLRLETGVYSPVTAGMSIRTGVCSANSGHLSLYDGQLRNVNSAWQNNTDASGCEVVDQASFSSWHSDIGIPISFQEESGFVTF